MSNRTPLDDLIQSTIGPISDHELARRRIIARSTLWEVRRGRWPRQDVVHRLVEACGVPIERVAKAIGESAGGPR